nr:MAG TPA: hypothetical protein [Caudoviricetes sp.]
MTFKQFFKYQSYTALIWTAIYAVFSVLAALGLNERYKIHTKKESEKSEDSES